MRPIVRPQVFSTVYRCWPVRALGVALLALALAGAGFAIGLRAGEGEQPDRGGDLRALVERSGGPAVVYSEYGENADAFWAANPSDPSDRIALGAVPHAPNYGVFASLSPDGAHVAYTAAGGSAADLWLLEVATGEARHLTTGVDLQSTPVWSNTSDAVIVRRSTGDENTAVHSDLLRVDLAGGKTTLASEDAGLYPIAFAPAPRSDAGSEGSSPLASSLPRIGEGSALLYYASLSASGTDLNVVDASGSKRIAHLSDGIARDWDLSPDGKRFAYLAPRAAGGFAANVLDVTTGESGGIASSSGPEFHPIWAPDGTLTVGRLGERLASKGTAGGQSSGFDVPLSWSPDGAYLIVRGFGGESTADLGPSWLWAIHDSGQRHRISDISDVGVAGWLEHAP